MSNEEDREALQAAILDTLKRWRLSALDVQASQIALRVRDEGFHRTPAPAPDVRALIHEARALVARADAWKRPGFPTEASEFVDALSDKVDRLTDALEAACATIAQLTTELDARFEHSDHTAAKYYQRMRAAEKEAAMRRSESADFERERDDLQADLDAEVDKNARYRTRNDELAAEVERLRLVHAGQSRLALSAVFMADVDDDEGVQAFYREWVRAHDAALIESLFDEVIFAWHSHDGLTVWENESHYDEGTPRPKPIKDWLRERARQVREGEA